MIEAVDEGHPTPIDVDETSPPAQDSRPGIGGATPSVSRREVEWRVVDRTRPAVVGVTGSKWLGPGAMALAPSVPPASTDRGTMPSATGDVGYDAFPVVAGRFASCAPVEPAVPSGVSIRGWHEPSVATKPRG